MNFVLTGFNHADTVRMYAFECIAADHSRTKITVRADLTLARKHQILPQELPLLCRRLLEMAEANGLPSSLTFTEDNMVAIEVAAREAAALKKPVRRTPPSERLGHAWRGPAVNR